MVWRSLSVVLLVTLCLWALASADWLYKGSNGPNAQEGLAGGELRDFGAAPAFVLEDQLGKQFKSEELKGRVWIANFFFTSCQGPCPLTMRNLAKLAKGLGKKAPQIVSFSVDPERDSVKKLGEYGKKLNIEGMNWELLRGEMQEIARIAENGFKLGSPDSPQFHSTHIALVDREGKIRGYYVGTEITSIKKLSADLEKLN